MIGLRRLLLVAATGLVAGVCLPPAAVALWIGVLAAGTAVEFWHLRQDQTCPGARVASRLFLGLMIDALGVALWTMGDFPIRIFAVLLICSTMISVLVATYARPRALLALTAPHVAVLAAITLHASWREGLSMDAGSFVVPIGTALLFASVLWAARLQLSEARARLDAAHRDARGREEAAAAASAAKSAFLATMSHEIRTPLNGVLGMAWAMSRDELPAMQRERLEVIQDAGQNLLALLNDALDLSRIESGRVEIEDGVVDISDIARGAQAAFTSTAAHKDLYFVLRVTPAARGLWRGDPTRVRQILHNLVTNALKFTDRGSVQVEIDHDGRHLVIGVADTGVGVAPHKLDGLFEKFVQEDASTTRRYGGSGLGLAICRELATLMGGEITAQSVLGQGSIFTVRLPLQFLGPELETTTPAAPAATTVPRAMRVLAAEDNPTNQLVLRTFLEQVGVAPHIVADGQQAVAAFEAGAWDVVLMDVQMPVMDGPTATARIRQFERESGRPRTPIIALTANAMAHQEAAYLAGGMDAVVAKPIQFERLAAALDAVLADASAHEPETPAMVSQGAA